MPSANVAGCERCSGSKAHGWDHEAVRLGSAKDRSGHGRFGCDPSLLYVELLQRDGTGVVLLQQFFSLGVQLVDSPVGSWFHRSGH